MGDLTKGEDFNDNEQVTATKLNNLVDNATINTDSQTANKISNLAFPSGSVILYAAPTSAPAGWLICDGSAVSRTTYSDLFDVLGTTWGAGNGSTTFNLPDYRGVAIRGWDNGRNLDPNRSFGQYQADEFESHTHSYSANLGEGGRSGESDPTNGSKNASTNNTTAAGGSETRMKNETAQFIIKT